MSDAWRKSSYSGSQANCVEVGNATGLVEVRDTQDRQGAVVTVSAEAWRRFMMGIKGLAKPRLRDASGLPLSRGRSVSASGNNLHDTRHARLRRNEIVPGGSRDFRPGKRVIQ